MRRGIAAVVALVGGVARLVPTTPRLLVPRPVVVDADLDWTDEHVAG